MLDPTPVEHWSAPLVPSPAFAAPPVLLLCVSLSLFTTLSPKVGSPPTPTRTRWPSLSLAGQVATPAVTAGTPIGPQARREAVAFEHRCGAIRARAAEAEEMDGAADEEYPGVWWRGDIINFFSVEEYDEGES